MNQKEMYNKIKEEIIGEVQKALASMRQLANMHSREHLAEAVDAYHEKKEKISMFLYDLEELNDPLILAIFKKEKWNLSDDGFGEGGVVLIFEDLNKTLECKVLDSEIHWGKILERHFPSYSMYGFKE